MSGAVKRCGAVGDWVLGDRSGFDADCFGGGVHHAGGCHGRDVCSTDDMHAEDAPDDSEGKSDRRAPAQEGSHRGRTTWHAHGEILSAVPLESSWSL